MEHKRITARCLSVESPASILIQADTTHRLLLENVQQPKMQTEENTISSSWVQGLKYLIQTIEGKQIEYVPIQKKKTFSIGKLFVGGENVISQMISQGFLKLNKQPSEWTEVQNQAKISKIGVWNDKKIQLKQIDEKTAKKVYDKLQNPLIKRCHLQKVEGLKLFMIDIYSYEEFIWYMSELKIPRMNGLDPRKAFVSTEDYIKDIVGKAIMKCEVRGCEIYKGQVSLYGAIYSVSRNLTEQLIKAGYTELSKNAQSIIGDEDKLQEYVKFQKQAKLKGYGFFKKKAEKQPIDTVGMSKTNKLKQYEFWIKQERRINTLKNPSQEIAEMFHSYKIEGKQELNSGLLKRLKTLGQVISVLLIGSGERYSKQLQQFFQRTCTLLSQLTGQLIINLQNAEFMKLLNILLRSLVTCINEIKDKNVLIEVEKQFKTIFRLTFIGNSIFHAKIFGKEKQIQLQNFSFNTYEFSSSSMSEISDDERPDKQHIKKKKLHDSYLKIRVSASLLIHQSLKLMPNLIESTWQLIVKPNLFSEQFVEYVSELPFKSEISPLKVEEKQKMMDLMKINFGEHSLLSMLIFQTNEKIKTNILNCLQVFICFYQGRKIIETLQYSKFQKEMKQIKSFIPKSFLVFSAYKNLFYTLLFCLSYQRFSEIRILLLKVISSIIDQTALLRKLPFSVGIQTLVQNIIFPILENDESLTELKLMAITCLSKIVGTEQKSEVFQEMYLNKKSKKSICNKLIAILKQSKSSNEGQNKLIINEINVFFSSFVNNYFQTFVKVEEDTSIWLQLLELEEIEWESFSTIIQNICKTLNNNNIEEEQENVQKEESKEVEMFKEYFTNQYLPQYLQESEKFTSSTALINLLNIYCQLKSDIWDNPLYERASEFLLDLFYKLSPQVIKFQAKYNFSYKTKPEDMRNNPYVRVAYLKLIGYMSFISKFKTKSIAKSAFDILLTIIKTAKGLNTLVKCSWALSNWCTVEFLKDILSAEQSNMVLKKLMQFAYSEKEKIASHGIRGLGVYTLNTAVENEVTEELIRNLQDSLILTLKSKSPKVSWNALVTLRTLMRINNFSFEGQLGSKFMSALISNFSINNFKLQLQTIQTLKCLEEKYIREYEKEIIKGVMNVLSETNKEELTEYSFKEFKYIDNLRRQIVRYLINNLNSSSQNNLKEVIRDIDLYLLLESIYKHIVTLKIEEEEEKTSLILQKGEEKGEEVEREIFNVKKKTGFDEEQQVSNIEPGCKMINLKLVGNEEFLKNLKTISGRIQSLIEEDQNIKINFSVVEGFQQLNNMTIKEEKATMKILEL